jgi:lipopolysaccharide export system ATP-binding protein
MTSELQDIIKEQSKYKGFIISDHRFQEVIDISDTVYLLTDSYLKQIKDFKELKQYKYLPKSI